MTTYKIRRFYYRDSEETETIRTGLSLEEAQEHCNDPETSSSTATGPAAVSFTKEHGPWFDGYDKE